MMMTKLVATKKIDYQPLHTPIGQLYLLYDACHLYRLIFAEEIDDNPLFKSMLKKKPHHHRLATPLVLQEAIHTIHEYFNGRANSACTTIPLFQGTVLQRQVWQALNHIPYGQTCSYKALAEVLNMPRAVRAVANAVAANPFPILIPCHRVVRSNGQLGGYLGGSTNKAWLLSHEQTNLFT